MQGQSHGMNFLQLSSIQPRSAFVIRITCPCRFATRRVRTAVRAMARSSATCSGVGTEALSNLRPCRTNQVEGNTVSSQSKMKIVSSGANGRAGPSPSTSSSSSLSVSSSSELMLLAASMGSEEMTDSASSDSVPRSIRSSHVSEAMSTSPTSVSSMNKPGPSWYGGCAAAAMGLPRRRRAKTAGDYAPRARAGCRARARRAPRFAAREKGLREAEVVGCARVTWAQAWERMGADGLLAAHAQPDLYYSTVYTCYA
mmetsp:Transcript_11929/g.31536  ORF Transcript_11929/g.31536 Transcript_11929/m.31536 type:complete len:256 (+) Transcript_11929:768-1535(+)